MQLSVSLLMWIEAQHKNALRFYWIGSRSGTAQPWYTEKKDHSIVLNELVKEPATSSSKLILHSCRVHISQSDKVARYQRLLSVLQTHFAYEDYERTRLSA